MSIPNKNKEAYKKITGGYVPVVTPENAQGMQGVGITGTERNLAKEMEASTLGYSPEYIASRGGINSQGYFNDVALSGQLTAAEQQSVSLPGGSVNTGAMAGILQKKAYDEAIARGEDPQSVISKLKNQWGNLYDSTIGAGNKTGGYDANGNPVTGGKYNPDGTLVTAGTGITSGLGGLSTAPVQVRTLGIDVFRQTLGMFFGETEMTKPWVSELYSSVSKFYKSGSTPDESFNLAVLDVQKNPNMTEFTKRFKGIYALQEMKQKGQAVTVPTVAEYFATEAKMGDILKQSSLGELATEDFLGDVLSKGVSATEFANRITAIFDRIDNAPKETKDTINRFFPSVDRVSLAKAIALGEKGAKELQSKIAGYEVLSAAEKQGLGVSAANPFGVTEESAYQYALRGETFDTALTKFGTVAAALPTVNKLTEIYNEPKIGQAGLESAILGKSAADIKRLEDIAKREEASFSGRSGVTQISLASQRRGAGQI